jgi:hypothetical protein
LLSQEENLYLNGNYNDEVVITKDDIEYVKNQAFKLNIFKGVKLKSESVNKHEFGSKAYELAAAEWSIGTDIAIRFGREIRCVRTPVTKTQVEILADFLNLENDKYYKTGTTYEWSFLSNNCTHLNNECGRGHWA